MLNKNYKILNIQYYNIRNKRFPKIKYKMKKRKNNFKIKKI